MRIVVLGAGGMLGHKMFQTLSARYPETIGTVRGALPEEPRRFLFGDEGRLVTLDALDTEATRAHLRAIAPDVIVNCVGIVKQRSEAKAAIPSITLNALLPHVLAECAREWGGRVIHFSTDCVFDGSRGGYTEEDLSDARDLYGQTKFLGEVATENALTLRTSIIGRELSHFGSLLEWFLAQRGGRVKGFKRAIYAGVTTNYLSRLVADMIADYPGLSGLYQVASTPISKYDMLCLLKEAYGLEVEIAPDEDFHCDRSMRGDRFQQVTGYACPPWPALVAELAQDPTPYDTWRNSHEALSR